LPPPGEAESRREKPPEPKPWIATLPLSAEIAIWDRPLAS